MRLESLHAELEASGLHTFIPLAFPSDSESGSVVDISGGTSPRGGVQKLYARILTRETHPKIAIDKAHEIKQYLYENVKGAFFDGLQVLSVEADTPEPLNIGEENGFYTVSFNYTIIEG